MYWLSSREAGCRGFLVDRRRLLLLVLVSAALATAGCLGGGSDDTQAGGSGNGGGAGDGGSEDGSGDGSDGGGNPYGFYDGKADPVESAPGTTVYRNETYGYRMLVPDGWKQVAGAPLWYVGPDPGIDEPRRNLNVAVESVGDVSQSEYVERGVDNVQRLMDAENLSVEAAILGGDEATRLSFDGTFRGTDLTWVQLVVVHGEHAYTVTYVFPQGEEPGHEEELATALGGFDFVEADGEAGGAGGAGGASAEPTAGI